MVRCREDNERNIYLEKGAYTKCTVIKRPEKGDRAGKELRWETERNKDSDEEGKEVTSNVIVEGDNRDDWKSLKLEREQKFEGETKMRRNKEVGGKRSTTQENECADK